MSLAKYMCEMAVSSVRHIGDMVAYLYNIYSTNEIVFHTECTFIIIIRHAHFVGIPNIYSNENVEVDNIPLLYLLGHEYFEQQRNIIKFVLIALFFCFVEYSVRFKKKDTFSKLRH